MRAKKILFLTLIIGMVLFFGKVSIVHATPYDDCIAQGGDYNDCKDRDGAPAGPPSPTPAPGPGSPVKCDPKKFTEYAGVCFPINTGLSETPVEIIVMNFMYWLLGIFGFIAIIGFAISGIQYLTSAGEEKAIETAKRNMKWSIIGVIVALAGFVIIRAVDAALMANPYF